MVQVVALLVVFGTALLRRCAAADDSSTKFSDSEAQEKNLDSKYTGTLKAIWTDQLHKDCPIQKFGPVANVVLSIGPPRTEGKAANPYYIKLAASGKDDLLVAFQTSRSTGDSFAQWWKVDSKFKDGGYDLSGELTSDVDGDKEANSFSGKLATKGGNEKQQNEIIEKCGLRDLTFGWTHESGATEFRGHVDSNSAIVTVNGTYTSGDREHKVSYSFMFQGTWYPKSAKMNTKDDKPTWSTATAKSTGLVADGPSFIYSDGALPTSLSTSSTLSTGNSTSSGLGRGAVAGLVVGCIGGGVFAIIMAIWWLKRRKAKKAASEIFPEIAYLYTPSPVPYNNTEYAPGRHAYSPPLVGAGLENDNYSYGRGIHEIGPSSMHIRNISNLDEVMVGDGTLGLGGF